MDLSFFQNIDWWQIAFYSFAFVVGIQLLYLLIFFSRVAFYKSKKRTRNQQHPVSVIVCARDEDENLARNLPALLVQEYPTTYEVVAVNDNSVDDSKYILQELKKTFKDRLEVVNLSQEAKMISGKKFPLSMGIKESHHEILLLTDADCVPASEHWVQKMQEAYDEGIEIVLGYGGYLKRPGLLNRLIRFETFHTAIQYLSFAMAGIPYMGVGRNLSYKKDLFFRNKGFSSINNIPGGDDDLFINKTATKKNITVVIDKDAATLSIPKDTWKKWLQQKKRHFSTAKYYKPIHKFLLGLYSFSHFFIYPLFILSAIFFSWKLAVIIYGVRFITQAIIYFFAMKKLNEKDLWFWLLFLDIWMFFYYIIFASALFKKAPRSWK
jgi:glycosyltransferase involved in cell wall biosynthesis